MKAALRARPSQASVMPTHGSSVMFDDAGAFDRVCASPPEVWKPRRDSAGVLRAFVPVSGIAFGPTNKASRAAQLTHTLRSRSSVGASFWMHPDHVGVFLSGGSSGAASRFIGSTNQSIRFVCSLQEFS